jgi:hypothetical protein
MTPHIWDALRMRGFDGQYEAWRPYLCSWVPLSLMAQLLVFCVAASDFSLQIDSAFCQVVLTAASFAVAGWYLISRNWGTRLGVVLSSAAVLQVLFLLGAPLSYVAASANFPLQDATFAYYDQMLGLDWRSYYDFVMQRPGLIPYAYIGYAVFDLLPIVNPLVLGLTKHYARLQDFTLACILTICATVAISAVLPAIGTYQQLGLPAESLNFSATGYLAQINELPFVRDGSLRSLHVTNLSGIVTFPSFHAAAAILSIWALWGVWWMRPFALIANGGMLLAAPLLGGHYFVDVFAGAGIAVLAIAAAKMLHGRSELFVASGALQGTKREMSAYVGNCGQKELLIQLGVRDVPLQSSFSDGIAPTRPTDAAPEILKKYPNDPEQPSVAGLRRAPKASGTIVSHRKPARACGPAWWANPTQGANATNNT